MHQMIRSVLKASDPRTLLPRKLTLRQEILRAGEHRYNLTRYRHVYVVGAGKASAAMAQALERILGKRITDGLVVVKKGYTDKTSRVRLREAAHPVPDRAGVRATKEMLSLLRKAGKDDLVIVLLSGGGSALLPLPVKGVTLTQKQRTTQLLLGSGASIHEMNVVRKHLSQVKGGRLLLHAGPARVLTLILSDVLGNPLDSIASGPTFPDPSTYQDAIWILKKYRLWMKLPGAVRQHLMKGKRGAVEETLKPGHPIFEKVQHLIIGDNRVALKAAAKAVRAAGFKTRILTSALRGEAREAARLFGAIARKLQKAKRPLHGKICLLASGETTVTIGEGKGRGGRCQEFALAAAIEIQGLSRTVVAAFGTDGTDGPTEVAGAYADEKTVHKAILKGLHPEKALQDHNSFPFFKALGQHIITGPTLTNLNDLYMANIYFISHKKKEFTSPQRLSRV